MNGSQDHSLANIFTLIQEGNSPHTVHIPDNWLQGRTAFGGLTAALGVNAMMRQNPSGAPLKSLLVSFVGPLGAGAATIDTKILRRGKSVTQIVADVKTGTQTAAHIVGTFGTGRNTSQQHVPAYSHADQNRLDFPPMDTAALAQADIIPAFLANFDIHWNGKGIPQSGTKDAHLGKWVQLKENMRDYMAERLVMLADVPPPLMMSHYTDPIMASSLTWSLEFLQPPADIVGDWHYLDYRLEAAAEGYSVQSGLIFDESGTLVAMSRQNMVYFE